MTEVPRAGLVPLARERAFLSAALLVLAAVGWVVILGQVAQDHHLMGPMETEGHTVGPDLTMGSAPLFFLMWVAMMVAMMFPSAAPMILVFARSQQGKHNGSTTLFVAAYLALWVIFGAVTFSLGVGVEALAERSSWVARNWARAGGVLLVTAGLYQLSPLKQRCLAKCRSPLSFLLQRWRSGPTGAVRMGLEHGVYCLGCCWLLFLVLVPLGLMNLAAMLMVTFVVFAEKALMWGRAPGHVAAAALVLYGLAVVVRPALLPTMA